jgi:hypothetical protein
MMPAVPEELWTASRKLWGNLLPFLLAFPFLVVGMRELLPSFAFSARAVAFLFLFTAVAYLSTGIIGAWRNHALARQLRYRLHAQGVEVPDQAYFVGFARPAYRSALDPHEDIGFVWWDKDGVEFIGERNRIQLGAKQVTAVRLRPNIHSVLGFGGWLVFEGSVNGHPVRLQVEPRSAESLWGNAAARHTLFKEALAWHQDIASHVA